MRYLENLAPGIPLVESPFFDEIKGRHWSGETLAIAEQLNTHGFAVIDFPEEGFNEIADGLKDHLNDLYDWDLWRENKIDSLRIQDAWQIDEGVYTLAANPILLNLLTKLYGRPAFPFQTLNFAVGTQQSCHSDHVHFSSIPDRFMCGVWVALEDVDESNGPLFYYPGSHHWPSYGNEHLGIGQHDIVDMYSHYNKFVNLWEELAKTKKIEKRHFFAKKGQALIWTSNLLHGGSTQLDLRRTRWSQVTHYFFENCGYTTPVCNDVYGGQILYRDIFNIATGERVSNIISGQKLQAESLEKSKFASSQRKLRSVGEFQRLVKRFSDSHFKSDQRIPAGFDAVKYLFLNPDVADAGCDPFEHFVLFGIKEGRRY